MATHSSILAWRIPWTEEPGGRYSPWGLKESDMIEHNNDILNITMRFTLSHNKQDFRGGSDGKASAYNEGHPGSIPGLGRSSEEGNGSPLQFSCLEKSHGPRSVVGYSPRGYKESDTTERLHYMYSGREREELKIMARFLA